MTLGDIELAFYKNQKETARLFDLLGSEVQFMSEKLKKMEANEDKKEEKKED